jgi:hypothetical protein
VNGRESRIDWTTAQYVFVQLPTCQSCGSARWMRQRTITTDESIERLAICLDCGAPHRIVTEFPQRGNIDYVMDTMKQVHQQSRHEHDDNRRT